MLIPSLIFALISWVLAVLAIMKKFDYVPLVIASFGSCCISAVLQFVELWQRAKSGDFAGIDDTIGATVFIVAVIMVITLVLNGIALTVCRKSGDDNEKR
ncbi:MAG: hypothetical protein NC110_04425 [Ruminococcus sp.]|nr:hypothetical protein [Ruminococcus sp.]